MSSEVGVLGAGSILPRAGYGSSGYVLWPGGRGAGGEVTLLDCGPGSVRALASLGVGLDEVRRVVLSHLHPDHCLDLFALAFARRNPALEAVPRIELIGPPGLARLLEEAPATFHDWARDPAADVREVDPSGGAVRTGDLELRCVRNGHSEHLTTLSWRVDTGRGALLYTGDTDEDPGVAELGRGVDLFLAECSFPDDEAVPGHLTPSSAARLARAAGARRLLLTHFYPAADPEECRNVAARTFDGPVDTARDGSVHRVAD